jgi:3-oxoacyl-[acyl-carrier protein] reductase
VVPDEARGLDRVAIVTAGSSGIGREITLELARRDYAIVVHYAGDRGEADAVVETVLAGAGAAITVRGDVTDELDVERLFAETTEAFGRIDVVVHVPGPAVGAPAGEQDLERLDALLRMSVLGTVVVNRQAARDVRDGGAIVNVAPWATSLALPAHAAYAASRSGIETITRSLAGELQARDVTVNSIVTSPQRRSDAGVARVVAFLVGPDGHWMNGHALGVDGLP